MNPLVALELFLIVIIAPLIATTALYSYLIGRISGFFRAWKQKVTGFSFGALGWIVLLVSIDQNSRLIAIAGLLLVASGWILILSGMRSLYLRMKSNSR